MFHVKHGAQFDPTVKACGQVELCSKEIRQSILYSYSSTDPKDIIERFYDTAMEQKPTSIFRNLAKTQMSIFQSRENFTKLIRNCKVFIALALADETENGTSTWKFFKDFNLSFDCNEFVNQDDLNYLKQLNYVNETNMITPKILEHSWEALKSNLANQSGSSQVEAEVIISSLFEKISNGTLRSKRVKNILKEKYATKLAIVNTAKNFRNYENNKIDFKIIGMQTLSRK